MTTLTTNTTNKENITGYNANKFVKSEHVFIEGNGSFFFSKEAAKRDAGVNTNFVGEHFVTIEHEGLTLYKIGYTNVWN